MKKITILLVLILMVSMNQKVAGQCATAPNIYSFSYNGKNYEVIKVKKSWALSAACAVERGGGLVAINDAGEQAAVYDAIINGAAVPVNYTVVPDGGGVAYVWIGATDQVTEGTWIWDGTNSGTGVNFWTGQGAAGSGGGAPVNGLYNNWGGNAAGVIMEPDNWAGNQDAAAIALNGWPGGSGTLGIAGEWNDINISNSLYFVVELNPTGIGNKEIRGFDLSPNPVKDILTIRASGNDHLFDRIRLIAMNGKEIRKMNFSPSGHHQIRVTDLTVGKYLVGIGEVSGHWVYYPVIIE